MIKKLFSKATLLLSIAGLALNILLVWLTDVFDIPLYLDSIGTVIVAALGGTLPGIAVGFLSNCLTALISVTPDPMTLYYGFLNVLIAAAAAGFSKKGLLRKNYGRILAVVAFAGIGGALGSVVTWVLYGFSFGQGISAPLANFLYRSLHMGKFAAQFTADIGIDLADKIITVAALCLLLRFFPKRAAEKLPLGYLYLRTPENATGRGGVFERLHEERLYRRRSIRTKITMLIVVSSSMLSIIALLIGSVSYKTG